jgi:hypothetical protein
MHALAGAGAAQTRRMVMDNQRFDGITKQLATGMSRRRAMKGVAVALGLSAVGALRAPTAARQSDWSIYAYNCAAPGQTPVLTNRCKIRAGRNVHNDDGSICTYYNTVRNDCCSSREQCEDLLAAIG